MKFQVDFAPYFKNNGNMISFFSEYYKNGVSVEKIWSDINSNTFKDIPVYNLSRFRIFLDSCLMIFNKEKLEKEYFKQNFEYSNFEKNIFEFNIQKYFEKVKQYDCINSFCEMTEQNNFSQNPIAIYDPVAERRYDEIVRLRNSFAHMQYGNFAIEQDIGIIPFYFLYNKDKGETKSYGIAFEPVIHEFINKYYSNQATYGIPYKHTFFSNIDEKRDKTDNLYFYEITYKFKSDDKYKLSDHSHPMIEYNKHQFPPGEIFNFIDSNPNFVIKNIPVDNYERMIKYQFERGELTEEEFKWFMKLLYDFETEFSNFILHLRHVVDTLIEWQARNSIGELDSEFKKQVKKKMFELKEDENDKVAFQTLFTILALYNIMLRIEDDDLEEFTGNFIEEIQFEYDYADLVNWCNNYYKENKVRENDKTELPRKFILEKIRNAVAHGNICLILRDKLKIKLIDTYNKRQVEVKVSVDEFKSLIKDLDWECCR